MRPFTINTSEVDLADLRDRLARTRFSPGFTDDGWAWGTSQFWLREFVDHWLHHYDWRRTESELNALPQVVGDFSGSRVHAFHVRSPHPDATPLILCHGWPGSIMEFIDCVPALTEPTRHGGRAEDAFHVVLPSLPGFALSGPTRTPGTDVPKIAAAFAGLMGELGYPRFLAQGGDWGAFVVRELGLNFGDRLIAAHVNFPWAVPPPQLDAPMAEVTAEERAVLRHDTESYGSDNGYYIQQATRPHSVGPGLEDSPVGLAAWLLEKFHTWSDARDGLPFSNDRLLDNTMLYWLNRTATSAARRPRGSPAGRGYRAVGVFIGRFQRISAPVCVDC